MEKLFKKTVNCETGEEIIEEFNEDDYAKHSDFITKMNEELSFIENRRIARESALAKLIDLGLTEEEIAALQADG